MKRTAESSTLVRIARALREHDAGRAAGRCFGASLELALQARRHGIEVDLVRWRIRGDRDFSDHWAVRLDGARVLDPTRSQVDGARRLVCAIDDYPANFLARTTYPARLFLDDYAALANRLRDRLPLGFMLSCARAMFRFEAVRSVQCFWLTRLLSLSLDLARAHVLVMRASALGRLAQRRHRLVERLGSSSMLR